MQFDSKWQRSKEIRTSTDYKFASTSESNLCLYDEFALKDEISLRVFEDIAAQRLKALKKIEELKQRHKKGTYEEYKASMAKELNPIFKPCTLHMKCSTEEQKRIRRDDVIGHFALRLAFCCSGEDIKKWFVTHEIELFRYRFQNETRSAILSFFTDNKFDAEMMSSSEKESRIEDLAASYGLSPEKVRSTDIWMMDALDALELVRKRKVLVHMGKACLEYDSLITIIVQRLRATMYSKMATANQYIGVEEQDRLLPLLERLTRGGFGGKDFNATEGQSITRHQIDSAASQFFPLCMTGIQSHLRKNHHLKHGSRRQYGLFLKAIGLSLDEAMAFFREEFTQKIDSDKFEKQYAYNIRHMYGKEGKRQEHSALSCSSIIRNNPPSHDDWHGCPFKYSSEDGLKSILKANKVKSEHIDEMIGLSKINQFDKACSLHWEVSRGQEKGSLPTLITHPNLYYELAREAAGGLKVEVKNQVQMEESAVIVN